MADCKQSSYDANQATILKVVFSEELYQLKARLPEELKIIAAGWTHLC